MSDYRVETSICSWTFTRSKRTHRCKSWVCYRGNGPASCSHRVSRGHVLVLLVSRRPRGEFYLWHRNWRCQGLQIAPAVGKCVCPYLHVHRFYTKTDEDMINNICTKNTIQSSIIHHVNSLVATCWAWVSLRLPRLLIVHSSTSQHFSHSTEKTSHFFQACPKPITRDVCLWPETVSGNCNNPSLVQVLKLTWKMGSSL